MKKKIFILLSMIMTLSSCDLRLDFHFSSQISLPEGDTNNYYQAETVKYSSREINSQIGWVTSKTTGNQSFLIVPVVLKDYINNSSRNWNSTKLENIEKAFFGEASDTAFESVRSYFYKSSYGNLDISGEVTDVFESNYTYKNLSDLGEGSANAIISEWYNAANSNLLKKYDTDKDGFVDNCIFIYSNDYDEVDHADGSRPFWAWCSAAFTNASITKPNINNYMWASYEFVNNTYADYYNANKIETHTFIHETGHLLGLDDYYSYDTDGLWNAAGMLDMQSYNVGDHNAFSKFQLGWIKPYVITGNAQITLKTSSKYPQAILINNNWNGSAFDEYILVEYYTPTGLNAIDSQHAYSYGTKMYNYNGLRIYHVDARLVKTTAKNGYLQKSNDYVDTLSNSSGYYTVIGASNSVSRSYLSKNPDKYRLLHLLDEGENNRLNNGSGGEIKTNSALWSGRKIFTPSTKFFANGLGFNDGSKIGYSISVSNLTDEECVVTIAKV